MTFAVDGKEYKPVSQVDCDLDQDGDTDADDAQIILNYAVGAIDDIDPKADVNGDGSISTYDAYLLLSSLETEAFSVPAGQSAQVTVRIVLPETVKEQLDAQYVNGAYVEGYVYVTPLTNAEGAIAPEHSIPVLAFYGNWSDASMYDKGTYASRLYGDETPPTPASPPPISSPTPWKTADLPITRWEIPMAWKRSTRQTVWPSAATPC